MYYVTPEFLINLKVEIIKTKEATRESLETKNYSLNIN